MNHNAFKKIQLIHKAIMLGIMLFMVVAVVVVGTGIINKPAAQLDRILQVVVLVLAAIAYFAGRAASNKKLLAAKEQNGALQKFALYKMGMLIFWIALEMPALLGIIGFILTGNYAFIVMSFVLLLLIAAASPAKKTICYLLELTEQEILVLENS
ncbi:MAG: hypothetical protein SFU21_09475 [Flavihumibacter sp.]|nr:hypothetical protein [Flavihumibacter sp.]